MARRLVLTVGEPAGIGPDLCLALAGLPEAAEVVVAGDPLLLETRARQLGLAVSLIETRPPEWPPCPPGSLRVWPVARAENPAPGLLDVANAGFVLEVLKAAVSACLQGVYDGVVTGPVSKASINAAGRPFTGHTEFIAELTGGEPVMMLVTPGLRVALATTHLPLNAVSAAIQPDRLEKTLRTLEGDLRSRFGLQAPRILVAGLNPHAGEGGHLGQEEITVIEPVIERLRQEGLALTGPLPADTLFLPAVLEEADAVLAMYHDQGLPVLKHRGFGRAVNVTLGLPIIRTSVDHGVALDLAGTGRADVGSLVEALRMASKIAGPVRSPQSF